jgi:hypothetical protein
MKSHIIDKPIVWAFWAHEPIQFYRRRTSDHESFLGNGEWIPAWYDRIHTEDAIARAAKLGVNLIYIHFYKGFGLEFEKEEMLRTGRLTEIAHRYGITVLGYCTISTVYYETLSDEISELESWVRHDENGKFFYPDFEGGFYSRWYPCSNSPYFSTYYRKILDFGIKEIGLDGFHFDNASNGVCYCQRCKKAFRKWLNTNVPDPVGLGMNNFKHVRIPPLSSSADPVFVNYLRYRRDLCARIHLETFDYVKKISKNKALVLYNPGIGRIKDSIAWSGYEPVFAPSSADLIFIETGNFIQKSEYGLNTSILAYKLAGMANLRALNTSWIKENGIPRIPETPEKISLFLTEGIVFGGICGTNWMARPIKKGAGMVMDDQMQAETLSRIFNYFKKHANLYVTPKHISRVKILYPLDSRMIGARKCNHAMHFSAAALVENGIPYSILQIHEKPETNDIIILPAAEYLSQHDIDMISSWNCRLLLIGNCGVYNEDGVERETKPFSMCENLELPNDFDDAKLIYEFKKSLAVMIQTEIQLNHSNIMVETAIDDAGAFLLHLINADNSKPIQNVIVSLDDIYDKCNAYSFDGQPECKLIGKTIEIAEMKTLCTLKLTKNSK